MKQQIKEILAKLHAIEFDLIDLLTVVGDNSKEDVKVAAKSETAPFQIGNEAYCGDTSDKALAPKIRTNITSKKTFASLAETKEFDLFNGIKSYQHGTNSETEIEILPDEMIMDDSNQNTNNTFKAPDVPDRVELLYALGKGDLVLLEAEKERKIKDKVKKIKESADWILEDVSRNIGKIKPLSLAEQEEQVRKVTHLKELARLAAIRHDESLSNKYAANKNATKTQQARVATIKRVKVPAAETKPPKKILRSEQ